MSRLIDGDKLIEDITIVINEWIKDMVYGEYLEGCVSFSVVAREMVRKQPTAFDVDKVVEKLKTLSQRACNRRNHPFGNKEYERGRVYAFDDAIEIVKAGGIDE